MIGHRLPSRRGRNSACREPRCISPFVLKPPLSGPVSVSHSLHPLCPERPLQSFAGKAHVLPSAWLSRLGCSIGNIYKQVFGDPSAEVYITLAQSTTTTTANMDPTTTVKAVTVNRLGDRQASPQTSQVRLLASRPQRLVPLRATRPRPEASPMMRLFSPSMRTFSLGPRYLKGRERLGPRDFLCGRSPNSPLENSFPQ